MKLSFVGLAGAATMTLALAQRIGDFTPARPEHIINEVERPFLVRAVVGTVVLEGAGGPLPKVLFEIEGPGTTSRIRRISTDQSGRFVMRHVPAGTYRFKATLNGFQSVMGTLIVSRGGATDSEIRIEMLVGV